MVTIDKEKQAKQIFNEFVEEYLENIKKYLPRSSRGMRLRAGGDYAIAVVKSESELLAMPLANAIVNYKKMVIKNGTMLMRNEK